MTRFDSFRYMVISLGLLSNYTPISLLMLKCSWAHTLSCLFMYCSFAILRSWCDVFHCVIQLFTGSVFFCLFPFVIFLSHDIWLVIPDLVLLLFHFFFFFLLLLYGCLLSQAFSSWYFSFTSGDPQRSGFKLHTTVLSVLCVTFQVYLSFVVNLSNVFLVQLPDFSLNFSLPFQWLQLLQV